MKKSTNSTTENILAERAYAGYLAGRLASIVPAESTVRTMLANRYANTNRQPCEVLTFLVGFRQGSLPLMGPDELPSKMLTFLLRFQPEGQPIMGPDEVLGVVHNIVHSQPARRRPRPDSRWGAGR